jgi:hypothetical protein
MATVDVFQLLDDLTGGRGPSAFLDMADLEIYECNDQIKEHYVAWEAPPREPNELRVHPATMSTRNFHRLPSTAIAVSDNRMAEMTFGVEPSTTVLESLRRSACGALLYADRVVEIDPLTHFSCEGYRFWPEEVARFREHFYASARLLEQARPLIESGVIILVPDPGAERWISDDFQAATELLGIEGRHPWPGIPWHNAPLEVTATAAALYDLRVAAAADAITLGIDESSWRAIAVAIQSGPDAPDAHVTVAAGVGYADLPFLTGIPIDVVGRLRTEEDAFREWRQGLRSAARLLRYLPSEREFREEAKGVFEDYLQPRAAAVRQSVSRSRALRSALRDEPLRAAFGAVASYGLGATLGLPMSGVLIGAAGGALGGIAATVSRQHVPEGRARIFYELLQ